MTRNTDLTDRNRQIAQALAEGKAAQALAQEYRLSPSSIYRAKQAANAERFAASDKRQPPGMKAGGPLFSELASTGLKRYGGRVDDEYDRVFKSLNKRVALYREMGDDPIVAAVLQATKMTIRRVSWRAQTDGTSTADKEATEWLATCLDDMSQSWTDIIDQALAMLQYGFYPAELVYKRRMGLGNKVSSKHDDGRIGWRKWTFIAPESLSPGDEWVFDDEGGLQGLNQTPPMGGGKIIVPISKAILFRTTAEKGNPESRAMLRAMYIPWYFKKNLEEIEAISAERMGAGLPVIYAGEGVGMGAESTSDASLLQDILRNVRADEQMGVFLPFPKMTADGKGVLFELMSPPSRGVINFHETITRHEQRMAMVGLAQFIHLGMNQVGARALGESSTDFFTLAVSGWADGIADTINRYAVERLFALNYFPGLTAVPYVAHESIAQTNIEQVADYVNKLVGAQLLTPSPELERYLRELADLPIDVDLNKVYAERQHAAELRASQPKVIVRPTPQTEPVEQASAEWFAEGNDGVMIAFMLDPKTARQLAVAGGEPVRELHLTLTFMGSVNDYAPEQLARLVDVVKGFALIHPPLSGQITGPGEFAGRDGVKPVVALVDVPGLPAWRQRLVEILALNGFKVSGEHGYIPHITLMYAPEAEQVENSLTPAPITFDRITLTTGGKRRAFKLSGDEMSETFAVMRGAGKPGARTKEINAVNAYQRELERIYAEWADDAAEQLAEADEDERDDLLAALLLLLLALLRKAGREHLPEAVEMGLDGQPYNPDVAKLLATVLEENETYLSDSFIPAVGAKVRGGLLDGDVIAALAAGTGDVALGGLLATMTGRVANYAGEWWKLYNRTTGAAAKAAGVKVTAYLDPNARHCSDCPRHHSEAGREYASYDDYLAETGDRAPGEFECGGGCRCWLEFG